MSNKHTISDLYQMQSLPLQAKIRMSKAKIMISGYESEMYNDYLHEWHKEQFTSCAEHSGSRTEVIWMNYELNQQMNLFEV